MNEHSFHATLIRRPIDKKSDNWHATSFQWLITLNDQAFDYYTGCGLVTKNGTPKAPAIDDVIYALISDSTACDMSFIDWCSDMGYDTDSRKALDVYLKCQDNAHKLFKAKIDIEAERIRLQDY